MLLKTRVRAGPLDGYGNARRNDQTSVQRLSANDGFLAPRASLKSKSLPNEPTDFYPFSPHHPHFGKVAALLNYIILAGILLISNTYAGAQPSFDQKDSHTLAQELKSEDAEVRFHAVREMMIGRLFQSSAQLKEILADKDGNVRIQGMLALGGVNDDNKLALLTSALGDENLDVRMLAVRMLADSGETGLSILTRRGLRPSEM